MFHRDKTGQSKLPIFAIKNKTVILQKKNINMAQLNKDEQKTLEAIEVTPYMTKTVALAEEFVARMSTLPEYVNDNL
jgi:hypothetical protein